MPWPTPSLCGEETRTGVLNRQFGNVRAALQEPGAALVEPEVAKFVEELEGIAERRPELAEKCDDLSRMLLEFSARLSGENES